MQPASSRRAPSDDEVAPRPERRRLTILVGVLVVLSFALWAQTAYRTVVVGDKGRLSGALLSGTSGAFDYEGGVTSVAIVKFNDAKATRAVVPEKIGWRRVTRIGDGAFRDCSALRSIELPSGVQKIDAGAFSGCASLTEVNLPQGVREIGGEAFAGCAALETITLPASLETFRDSLKNCVSLTAINVAPGNQRFKSVDGVLFSADGKTLYRFPSGKTTSEYAVPDGVETIASGAFLATAATEITLPASVREIGGEAFLGCVSLGSIALPDGVQTIATSTFRGCASLRKIQLPQELRAIGPSAFENCYSLSKIAFPEGVEIVGESAFTGCRSLTSVGWSKGLRTVDASAFYGCFKLSFGVLPFGLRTIGSKAFYGCALQKVVLPSSVESFENDSFGNRWDESITLVCVADSYAAKRAASEPYVSDLGPDFPISYRARLFYDQIVYVQIDASADEIARNAELWSSAPDESSAPDASFTWRRVDGGVAIARCNNQDAATHLWVPEALEGLPVVAIDSGAFSDCGSLESITLPSGLRRVDANAFSGCASLKSIDIVGGEHFLTIDGVLYSADAKTLVCRPAKKSGEFVVPATVETLADGAFAHCVALTKIAFAGTLETLPDQAFSGCASLRSVELPNGLRKIGDQAFQDCVLLRSVDIPEGVETIGAGAFLGCGSLTEVNTPSSLTTIGEQAFDVRCATSSLSSIGAEASGAQTSGLTLRGPAGSVAEEYARKNKIRFEAR